MSKLAPGLDASDAEQDLIACVLNYNSHLAHVADAVEPEHFHDASHRELWKAIQILRTGGFRHIDAVSLSAALRRPEKEVDAPADFLPLLVQLTERGDNLPAAASVDFAVERAALVREAAQRRELTKLGGKLLDSAAAGADCSSLVADIAKTTHTASGRTFRSVRDSIAAEFAQKPKPPLPSHDPEFNNITKGGFRRGTLSCIGGGTGCGKTGWILSTCATNCRLRIHVLYISTELTQREITCRLLGPILGREWTELEDGGPEIIEELQAATPDWLDQFFHFYRFKPSDTVAAIVDNFVAKWGFVPMVIVDHCGDLVRYALQTSKRKIDPTTATSQVSLELREVSVKHDAAVVAVVTTSRSTPKDIDPDKDSARLFEACAKGSGDIEYDCSILAYLLREDMDDNGQARAYLALAKSRRSANVIIKMTFNGALGTFSSAGAIQREFRSNGLVGLEAEIFRAAYLHIGDELTKNKLAKLVGGTRARVLDTINRMLESGQLVNGEKGLEAVEVSK